MVMILITGSHYSCTKPRLKAFRDMLHAQLSVKLASCVDVHLWYSPWLVLTSGFQQRWHHLMWPGDCRSIWSPRDDPQDCLQNIFAVTLLRCKADYDLNESWVSQVTSLPGLSKDLEKSSQKAGVNGCGVTSCPTGISLPGFLGNE